MDDAKFGVFFKIGTYIVKCYVILVLMFSNNTKSNIIYLRPCKGHYLLPKVSLTCSLSHYSVCQKDFLLKIIYRKFKMQLVLGIVWFGVQLTINLMKKI